MRKLSRRSFLAGTAAFSAAGLMGNRAFAALPTPRVIGANEKIHHACIGVGGMGFHDFSNFLAHPRAEIVAICDVDENNLKRAAEKVPNARRYRDWRELLEKEGDAIDSVNAAVPDHMHAVIAMNAMRRGKHVYCQKPLCHDVAECRLLADTVRDSKVVTQLGTQHASGAGDMIAVQWLRQGVIGEAKYAYLASNRTGAIRDYRLVGPRPAKGEPPPATLAWDLWIGTAPEREFAPGIYHQVKWRAWQDFGTGWSGDIGCHIFDAVWKGLNMGALAPISVRAEVQESWKNSPARRADVWPQSDHITWTFPGIPATGGKPFTFEWFDGEIFPPEEAQRLARDAGFERFPEEAAMVVGTEGAILIPHTCAPVLIPKAKFASLPRPKVPPRNHYHHFLDACLGGEMCESHFVQTGPMAETIILGTVAIRRPDVTLNWDAKALRVTNDEEANRYLRRTYRKGWEI
ncbi:MAG: Gfo/Idh/MocA family oxidoreductase [Kiritimatiellae bacterium]|nr:Gfo/Idh/MocA family oxidoreductase [Kiritimatiellia bacterium]